MIQGVLSFLILVPSFIVGMGLIAAYWLSVPALAIFVKAVFSIGEHVPDQDFRNISPNELEGAQRSVNVMAIGLFILAAIAFGLGKLFSWILL